MDIAVEEQCRKCGSRLDMDNINSQITGKCYTCRRDIYVRNELIKIFGPPRVPDLPVDAKGDIMWEGYENEFLGRNNA